MGYKEIILKLPPGYEEEELLRAIQKEIGTSDFSHQIIHKSLDSRKKSNIFWQMKVDVISRHISGERPEPSPGLQIPFRKRDKKIIVAGSGPAGFFSACVLNQAGFQVTVIERGSDVIKRAKGIKQFETTGVLDEMNNYAFGEGGAGTFSDGKLTSRSKHITKEKTFMIERYIKAGAPPEIGYLAHPHLGSDNLRKIVINLRNDFLNAGGQILFETQLTDLVLKNDTVMAAITTTGEIEADAVMIAPGHSAYDTYRMLIKRGVKFRTKHFAIGCRVEHPQELINEAQWGKKYLPGVKAAEYRLAEKNGPLLPVYTFCMCPGGAIVPATPFKHTNIVNGMSFFKRDGRFANAACVAGVSIERLLQKETSPACALSFLESLEERFFTYSNSYKAPFCGINDFIQKKLSSRAVETSYPLGLAPAPLWELLPPDVSVSIREGLKNFTRKIKGFETGNIMGLESKTSSPVQVVRDSHYRCDGFQNLYLLGEGSGFSGGIVSSGADGIRAAMQLIDNS
ncbi:MAG: FAD-dependent monooxygenase [Proteobacteria bacterium]|nr:FAD-dependent monooxygenase [Pseudomonadota bacterium]